MKQLDVAPNSQEWLEARKAYHTASEAAIVLGISPWTKPEKFKQIRAGLAKQFYNTAMKRGHDTEAQIRDWANKKLGKTFKEEVWVHGEYLASLDGIDGDVLVEIKCSDHTYNDLENGVIPKYYWYQVQQQLHCSPATTAYLVAYSPKKDAYNISEVIPQDTTAMEDVAEAWVAFDAMPMPEGPLDLSEDGKVQALFTAYAECKAVADSTKLAMDDIKDSLIALAQDRSVIAGSFKLTKKVGVTRYDYKKAAADAKVDLESYKSVGNPTYSISLPANPFL